MHFKKGNGALFRNQKSWNEAPDSSSDRVSTEVCIKR